MKLFKLVSIALAATLLLSGCNMVLLSKEEKGIDLYGTYDENDLLIDEIVKPLQNDDIKIPVIKGLKNKGIQKKINDDMYNRATALIDKYENIGYANYYTYANFANVISISFTVGFDEEPYSESIYFNYSLIDGSEIRLEDLFKEDTNLTDIIRSAIYNEMSLYGGYDRETYVHYPNEAEVYKITKAYLNAENKTFAFSPSGIYLYPKNHFAEIKMIDYADSVTVYSKFLTKNSIFTGEYPGFKNAFTCSTTSYDFFETIEYGYIENNLWYDITSSEDYFPEKENYESEIALFESFSDNKFQQLKEQLDSYRTLARENPDMFYIVLIKPHISLYKDSVYRNGEWYYSYSDMAIVSNQVFVYSMPMHVYNEVYRDKIIETYRYEYFVMRGGAYLEEPTEEDVIFDEIISAEVYNYVTGDHLTKIRDVFDLNSDYISVIEDYVEKELINEGYSYPEARRLVDSMVISLSGEKVTAKIPSLPDFSENIYFSSFEREHFKLFN